ncbi:hypothetical protein BaRGS_00023050 [Batillaria attramentaria]|uniref:Uncharacterized protein n=1 Tax=Batillaria attramentaria TaxID=370345 RepID=A0ABD0KF17_9CAEN
MMDKPVIERRFRVDPLTHGNHVFLALVATIWITVGRHQETQRESGTPYHLGRIKTRMTGTRHERSKTFQRKNYHPH